MKAIQRIVKQLNNKTVTIRNMAGDSKNVNLLDLFIELENFVREYNL